MSCSPLHGLESEGVDVLNTIVEERPGAADAPGPFLSKPTRHEELHRVVYRSRALIPLDGDPLNAMLRTARRRNHQMGVSGLLVAGAGHYLQWLEGPAEGVHALMRSISLDRRHDSIQVLTDAGTKARTFSGWDMRLASDERAAGKHPALSLPTSLIEGLWTDSEESPDLLSTLGMAIGQPSPARLQSTVSNHILQRLSRHEHADKGTSRASVRLAHPDLDRIVAVLISGAGGAAEVIAVFPPGCQELSPHQQLVTIVEPVAWRLGDLCDGDVITAFDVTIALGRLQGLVRHLGQARTSFRPSAHGPRILVASLPAETHWLGAVVDSEWLWMTGRTPAFELLDTDDGLENRLSAETFDFLDLAMSPCVERLHWMGGLRTRLNRLRDASRNPSLRIRIAGRGFAGRPTIAGLVGADWIGTSVRDLALCVRSLPVRPMGDGQ